MYDKVIVLIARLTVLVANLVEALSLISDILNKVADIRDSVGKRAPDVPPLVDRPVSPPVSDSDVVRIAKQVWWLHRDDARAGGDPLYSVWNQVQNSMLVLDRTRNSADVTQEQVSRLAIAWSRLLGYSGELDEDYAQSTNGCAVGTHIVTDSLEGTAFPVATPDKGTMVYEVNGVKYPVLLLLLDIINMLGLWPRQNT